MQLEPQRCDRHSGLALASASGSGSQQRYGLSSKSSPSYPSQDDSNGTRIEWVSLALVGGYFSQVRNRLLPDCVCRGRHRQSFLVLAVIAHLGPSDCHHQPNTSAFCHNATTPNHKANRRSRRTRWVLPQTTAFRANKASRPGIFSQFVVPRSSCGNTRTSAKALAVSRYDHTQRPDREERLETQCLSSRPSRQAASRHAFPNTRTSDRHPAGQPSWANPALTQHHSEADTPWAKSWAKVDEISARCVGSGSQTETSTSTGPACMCGATIVARPSGGRTTQPGDT